MLKAFFIIFSILVLVGCEATNKSQPSKPFGISKLRQEPMEGEHFLKDIIEQPEMATYSGPVDESAMSALRSRYGIPDSKVISDGDVNAMIRLYTLECLRLQERRQP